MRCLLPLLLPLLALSKEFVATSEWQVLPPEDSIPAGLHVRMDMTTGQRFAKISSEDDTDLITTQEQVKEMRAMGNGMILSEKQGTTVDDHKSPFDYDMMFRMYDRIPMDARPAMPDAEVLTREEWEAAMREIWDQRQATIGEAMAQIEEIPDVLKSLIIDLGEEPTVNVLQDLEYLLSDLDIARDFYILKGWPLLLSTLAHDKSRPLRSLAAHCIGNAVKNQEEFHDWAVAKGPGDKDVLEVVLDAIKEEVGGGAPGGGGFLVKLVYAAGSLLRGNPVASHRFVELGGGDVVGSLLKTQSHDLTLMTKLLALATDLIETQTSSSAILTTAFTGTEWCTVAAKVLRSEERVVNQEKILLSIEQLFPYCELTAVEQTKLKAVIANLKSKWVKLFGNNELDGDWRRDLDGIADRLLELIKHK